MADPRVVNLRGLGNFEKAAPGFIRVDRGSPWGNPFKIGDLDPEVSTKVGWDKRRMKRERVLELYEQWLVARLAERPTFLEPLRGFKLACWCAPLPCHANIILKFLDAAGEERKS